MMTTLMTINYSPLQKYDKQYKRIVHCNKSSHMSSPNTGQMKKKGKPLPRKGQPTLISLKSYPYMMRYYTIKYHEKKDTERIPRLSRYAYPQNFKGKPSGVVMVRRQGNTSMSVLLSLG